jgi:oligoendopeptidase F
MYRRSTWNGVWLMTAAATLWAATTALAGEPAPEVRKVPERKDIDQKYLWNLESTFKSLSGWEAEYAAVDKLIDEVATKKGTLGKGPDELLAALKLCDGTEARLDRVVVYSHLVADQDKSVNANQALEERSADLRLKYRRATSWMEPELTQIPQETLNGWMDKNKDLAVYRHSFDNLFRLKKYILSPREEDLIAMGGRVFSNPEATYDRLMTADMRFPTITDEEGKPFELSDAVFYKCVRSTDRRMRKDGYEGIVGTYAKFRNTMASLLNGEIQGHIFRVKARGYKNCLDAALEPGNIPPEVYNNLVQTVNENLPLLHRYTSLRKKVLKLTDGVHDYDLYCPLTKKQKLEYSYEDGVKLILDALAPMGPEYLTPMKKGFDSRWVDVFPTKNKHSGAYSSGTFLTQPYILLNFFGSYDDVSTLAHEMGHSMHSFFSRGTQPYVYSDYDIFCAEVASTTNEVLLQNYVLKHVKDPQTKLYLLVEFLETFRGTVFRQTMFSEFEQKIHELAEAGTPLTADELGKTYGAIMKKYYGPDYVQDPLVDNYWIRIPHFYMNFYVYKYATSYCAATNIARRISEDQPGAVQAYLKFLKSGSSEYPIELLKDAGVDMTTPEPIEDAMQHFKDLLDQTEKLLTEVQ